MNVTTPNISPAYIRRQLGVIRIKNPEIVYALEGLDELEQECILRQASRLANLFRNVGAAHALELVYKLARTPYKLEVVRAMGDRETADAELRQLVGDLWQDALGEG